ncbi:MazG nucleotide pyrophosphohydrolase domain-containing protein [Nonomuraea fuscirosea]
MHLRDIQKRAWENKLAKGFNTTDLPLEFALAHGELSEAFEAARKHPETLGEELADVLIFLTSIAEMKSIDLDAAVEAKMAKNKTRRYERGPHGTLIKTDEEAGSNPI